MIPITALIFNRHSCLMEWWRSGAFLLKVSSISQANR